MYMQPMHILDNCKNLSFGLQVPSFHVSESTANICNYFSVILVWRHLEENSCLSGRRCIGIFWVFCFTFVKTCHDCHACKCRLNSLECFLMLRCPIVWRILLCSFSERLGYVTGLVNKLRAIRC